MPGVLEVQKYTNRTPEEAIQKYIQQIVLCRDDLDRALSLDPDNPLALFFCSESW